jgi:ferredoxin-nitrate reductase
MGKTRKLGGVGEPDERWSMTDRIANPWGDLTPFGPGEEWPVRVDLFLEEGVSEEEVDSWVQTASILHSNGDALDIAVKDGRRTSSAGRRTARRTA